MYFSNEKYVIKNSKGRIYIFYIHNGDLIVEELENNNVIKKFILRRDIVDYSVDIDEKDKIHIIYFNTMREMKYCIYSKKKLNMNIFKAPKNIYIRSLKIKASYSNINIFFIVDYLDERISSIHHKYFNNNKWIGEKVAVIKRFKYNYSYFIDTNREDLYIFYCSNHYDGHYKIRKYNIIKKAWDDFEYDIIIKELNNSSFFLTPKNKCIICFNKLINNNIQTLIKYKDLNIEDSEWSSEINVSCSEVNTFKPKVIYCNKYIYVIWKQGNNIVYKKSKDLLNWSSEYTEKIENDNPYEALYIENNFNKLNLKANHVYMSHKHEIYPSLDMKLDVSRSKEHNIKNNILNEASVTLKDIIKTKDRGEIESSNNNLINKMVMDLLMKLNYDNKAILEPGKKLHTGNNKDVEALIKKLESKNQMIESLKTLNLNLLKKVIVLGDSVNKYEKVIHKLKAKNLFENRVHFNMVNNYENKIKAIKKEKSNLIIDRDRKDEEAQELIKAKIEKGNANLKEILESKNLDIKNAKMINVKLSNEIEVLKNLIDKHEDNWQNIRIEKIADKQKYAEDILKYENSVKKLSHEKDNMYININKKIETLFKIIEEKDIIIQSLYRKIELEDDKSSL